MTEPEMTEIADGVFVTTSEFMLTRSTVVAGADGSCLLIDPGVTVAEMVALAGLLDARGLRPVAGWATHPHWDHVLWHSLLGDVPRYAAPAAAEIAQTDRDGMFEGFEQMVASHDLSLFGRLVALDGDSIPWDGPRAEVVIHDAHAPGHGAVFLPDTGVLVAGDMLSDVEIPLLDTDAGDPMGGYRTGLARLAAVAGVRQVVPGHGHVGDAEELRRRVAADTAYLDRLATGEPFDYPRITQDRLSDAHEELLRTAHEEHLRYIGRLQFGRIRLGRRLRSFRYRCLDCGRCLG